MSANGPRSAPHGGRSHLTRAAGSQGSPGCRQSLPPTGDEDPRRSGIRALPSGTHEHGKEAVDVGSALLRWLRILRSTGDPLRRQRRRLVVPLLRRAGRLGRRGRRQARAGRSQERRRRLHRGSERAGGHCCVWSARGMPAPYHQARIRSPMPVRRTRPPTAGSATPLRRVRNARRKFCTKPCPAITVLALRSCLSPRIGRSLALRRPWSASIRLLPYWSVRCHAAGSSSSNTTG
jgi:hypothetical protein